MRFLTLLFTILVLTRFAQAASLPDSLPCTSCFIGTLQLSPNPKDPGTKILDSDLYFVDTDSVVWKAGAGDVTDGASIPPLFQPIIGGAWEQDYLPAAVIHDHYTTDVHYVRTWQATAKVFYEAMIVNHTDVVKAKTMYYAVYTFGPHWDKLKKGTLCGHNCTFDVHTEITFSPADYDSNHAVELTKIETIIRTKEVEGEPLSLVDIENIANIAYPVNPFLHDNIK